MRTLASDGTDGKWTYYGGLSDWESAHNLWGERHFVGWLAGNLAARELAEIRRAAFANEDATDARRHQPGWPARAGSGDG